LVDVQLSNRLGGIVALYMVQENICNLCNQHQQDSGNLYIYKKKKKKKKKKKMASVQIMINKIIKLANMFSLP
jgi:hypothetical protein